jgi:uncharacterized membrane protein SpoIIM required for sporulation
VIAVGDLYRASAADLALARRAFPGDPIVDRLERLVRAARQAVYSERTRRGSLRAFAAHGYWRGVRAHPAALALAAAGLLGPAVLAAAWAAHDPGAAIGLLPSAFRGAADPHLHRLPSGAATQAALASSIFTNNIQVTFLAFSGGLTLGAVTLFSLVYNGLLLGALAGLTIQAGTFSVFLRYVVPHGVLELSCIAVAAAAGLSLADAIISPGTASRGDSLRARARPAIATLLGTAPWLVVAGLVEGFVTPRGVPLGAALAIGLGLGATYWGLVWSRGRSRPSQPDAGLGP